MTAPTFEVRPWDDAAGYNVYMKWQAGTHNMDMVIPVDGPIEVAKQVADGLDFRFKAALGMIPRVVPK